MSEEIKDILNEFKIVIDYNEIQNIYRTADLDYNDAKLLLDYIDNLQQKVEQLEKENKELKQPQVFIDCEDMEERYGRDLYEDYLKGKIEQLENIRKETIKYVQEKADYPISYYHCLNDILNILNKGDEDNV